uniref:NADH dehydrogenase subunit 4L n=1 Tax=Augilodes binghami TaxID=2886263 RepID=UPI001E7A6F13|nr:NADH dehydrogenase subunit 4L [Augilodes binghami]UDL72054.1 NADH dehydrogenase subunit 4L [Augilodes binghami]
MFLYILIFISGMVGLIFVRKYFLLSLLMLEFMSISLFGISNMYFSFFLQDNFFSIIFLILVVCEGVLGLSLIVYMVRKNSFDYLLSMSLC